ncbi:hypothetical protein KCU97_g485, partial [Aureobasidium melanogenum]
MAPINTGDELLIPLFSADNKPVTVQWSQNLSQRTAQYFALVADNISTGEQVPFFIAAEFYKTSTAANPNHITKVGQLVDGEGYKIKVDDKIQYGQKNAQGELRFVVYHDKERKRYQHRFIETALGSAAAGKASELAKGFGFGDIAGGIASIAKNFVGDYLRTF